MLRLRSPGVWLFLLLAALVAASLFGPRPVDPRLAALRGADTASDVVAPGHTGAACEAIMRGPRLTLAGEIEAAWSYTVCSPATTSPDDWAVDLTLAPRFGSRARLSIDGGTASCEPDPRVCRLTAKPWQVSVIRSLSSSGAVVGPAQVIVWYQRRGLNLDREDVFRVSIVAALGLLAAFALRTRRARTLLWGPRSAWLVAGSGAVVGAFLAVRPSGWGGTSSPPVAALAIGLGLATTASLLYTATRVERPGARVLVTLAILLTAGALLTPALEGRVPHARDMQLAIIACALVTTSFLLDSHSGLRTLVIGLLFGFAAVALDDVLRAPLPYPDLHGVYRPWELVSHALIWVLVTPLTAHIPRLASQPARWTRRLDAVFASLAEGSSAVPEHGPRMDREQARAQLARTDEDLQRGRLPVPNPATEAYVCTVQRALQGPEHASARTRRGGTTLLLVAGDLPLRGRIALEHEPRAVLFEGDTTLRVYDGEHPAALSLATATHIALDAIDTRLGATAHRAACNVARFEHPGGELLGRSFELPLALAWYALRTGTAERNAGVLATGGLAADHDSLLRVEGLLVKLMALAPGEILLAPLTHADELPPTGTVTPDLRVWTLTTPTSIAAWRVRRASRRHARRGGRAIVLVPTLSSALRFMLAGR